MILFYLISSNYKKMYLFHLDNFNIQRGILTILVIYQMMYENYHYHVLKIKMSYCIIHEIKFVPFGISNY